MNPVTNPTIGPDPSPVQRPDGVQRGNDRPFTPLHAFFVLIILVAGGLFCFKLFAFLSTIKRDELAGFAYDPVLTYGFVAMGFLCLLAWAYLSGQFRDIERPKYDMLERFERQERAEAERAEHAKEVPR